MSWSTFTERWPLFVGAVLTVCLGVALVQSSLLVLISAATLDAPAGLSAADRFRFGEGTSVAVTVAALTLAFSAFLAVFVVSSTFAFTVAQRRRDLALLRLVGGGRGQLRRLLLSEAVLLGAVGTVTGVPVGIATMSVQSSLLRGLGFLPDGFAAQWRWWILGVSSGVGVGVAVAGVLVAAHRAAQVRPLEALRDTGEAARVMTAGRWVFGGLFTAGAVALIVVAPVGGPAGGMAMSVNVALCASVALSALSPLLVPAVARLVPAGRGGLLAELAQANLRSSVRRSASVAAPLIVLVGLVLGQSGALTSFAAAGADQQRRQTAADLVVEATGPVGPRITAVPGVAAASTEIEVPVTSTRGSGDDAEQETTIGLVVDPVAYARLHPGTGPLDALRGRTVADGPGGDGGSPGETIGLRVGDVDLGAVAVVDGVPDGIGGGAGLLLPPDLAPLDVQEPGASRTFVALHPGADAREVAGALAAVGVVHTAADWIARDAAARDTTSRSVFAVVMGLGALYTLFGVVNAVVMGATARREEFAVARAVGLHRGQVVGVAVVESAAVTGIGLLLGLVGAAGTFVAVLGVTAAVTGVATLALPWGLVVVVCAGAFLVTGLTTAITSWAVTRPAAAALLGARE